MTEAFHIYRKKIIFKNNGTTSPLLFSFDSVEDGKLSEAAHHNNKKGGASFIYL